MKRGGMGGGMGGGMQNLMRQANQMQLKMKKLQEELDLREHEGTSGGGAVTVKVKGEREIISLKISDEVVKAGDVEMLQDLVVTAANDAHQGMIYQCLKNTTTIHTTNVFDFLAI